MFVCLSVKDDDDYQSQSNINTHKLYLNSTQTKHKQTDKHKSERESVNSSV